MTNSTNNTIKAKSSHAEASKMIKDILKHIYPKIKFSVKSKSYSGGDSITVSWQFGPTTKEIDKIIQDFREGDFDGMTDSYRYTNTNDNIPQVKYIFTRREFDNMPESENDIYHLLGKEFAKMYNVEYNSSLYFTLMPRDRRTVNEYIGRLLSKTSFTSDRIEYIGIEKTNVTCGYFEEFYTIKYAEKK